MTIFGLPMAILVFMHEQRRERQGDEEEDFQTHIRKIAQAEAAKPK
ncbi:MAG TPA: hypothetical protein P5186_06130 [Candidatus Paceibacterota bacterium]|nr:hypothetical protein [Verrucomicrobiota bacterium]HRY47606.1 hypothetical protein [Candidatus Paceibacterota bacterium]HSA02702.1 hypothetical protein [Candidatus Paceibacterota bacterium]